MEQSDPQRHMQNGHPVRTIVVVPGSELEALLKKMEREKITHGYTTLDAVARQGCHAAVARPIHGLNVPAMASADAKPPTTPENDR